MCTPVPWDKHESDSWDKLTPDWVEKIASCSSGVHARNLVVVVVGFWFGFFVFVFLFLVWVFFKTRFLIPALGSQRQVDLC